MKLDFKFSGLKVERISLVCSIKTGSYFSIFNNLYKVDPGHWLTSIQKLNALPNQNLSCFPLPPAIKAKPRDSHSGTADFQKPVLNTILKFYAGNEDCTNRIKKGGRDGSTISSYEELFELEPKSFIF